LLASVQLFAACQAPARPSVTAAADEQARPLIDRPITTVADTTARARLDNTVQVRRGLLRDTVIIPGTVVSGRSTQLGFATAGMVSAVHVRPGDVVRRGDPLVEISLDEGSVEFARTQATLASLAYDSQRTKVESLRSGAGADQIATAQAAVARAEASLRQAEQQRDMVARGPVSDVALQQIAVDQAQDDASIAQAAVTRAQALSAAELATATSAAQAAQRKLELASTALEQALAVQADPTGAKAVEVQQTRVQQAQAVLDAAKAAETRTRQIARQGVYQANTNLTNVRQTTKDAVDNAHAAEQRARDLALAQLDQARAQQQLSTSSSQAQSTTVGQRQSPQAATAASPQQVIVDASSTTPASVASAQSRVVDLTGQEAVAQALIDSRNAEREATVQVAAAQTAVRTAQEQGDAQIATAVEAVATAERGLRVEQASLDQITAKQRLDTSSNTNTVQAARAAQDQARSDYTEAVALVDRVRQGLGTIDPVTAEAVARASDRKVTTAAVQLDQTLANQRTNADVADVQVRAAREELGAAQAKLALLTRGTSQRELQQEEQRLTLLAKQAEMASKSAQMVNVLTAPFDGEVTLVSARPGDLVQARTMAVSVADPLGLSVVANASQYDVAKLRREMTAEVTFPGLGDSVSSLGTIATVSGAAAAPQGSSLLAAASGDDDVRFPVQVDLASFSSSLRVGMTASVSVPVNEVPDALSVPISAVHRTQNGGATVTVVAQDGQSREAAVQLGGIFGTDVQIISGVSEGDLVVLSTPTILNANQNPRSNSARTAFP
jgi:multidrug efflux pump subunit AcrA (membrane-fusion protein)